MSLSAGCAGCVGPCGSMSVSASDLRCDSVCDGVSVVSVLCV